MRLYSLPYVVGNVEFLQYDTAVKEVHIDDELVKLYASLLMNSRANKIKRTTVEDVVKNRNFDTITDEIINRRP